ncbi:MAG: dual specificity protein phosphatase [Gammaproteobacteria bacterium]
MDYILEHLAIGDAAEGTSPPAGITAVLCVAEEIALAAGFSPAHKVPITDMQPVPPHQLAEAVNWISRHIDEQTILVYCNSGVGRASSVVVGFLCLKRGMGFGEAVQWVAERRPYMSTLPALITSIAQVAEGSDGGG